MTAAAFGPDGYRSPSGPPRGNLTPFQRRKFWQVCIHPVEPHLKRDRRQWFDPDKAERRTFEVLYGFNPRCCDKGSYGKPGTFHWRRHRA